jgi:hypothetical protein
VCTLGVGLNTIRWSFSKNSQTGSHTFQTHNRQENFKSHKQVVYWEQVAYWKRKSTAGADIENLIGTSAYLQEIKEHVCGCAEIKMITSNFVRGTHKRKGNQTRRKNDISRSFSLAGNSAADATLSSWILLFANV